MNRQDKIEALWLDLELIFNALEELGEDPYMLDGDAVVYGESASLRWDVDAKRWNVHPKDAT